MKEVDKKTLFSAFAQLFVLMIENKTDNIEMTFDFKKCKAKFNVELIRLEKVEDKGE